MPATLRSLLHAMPRTGKERIFLEVPSTAPLKLLPEKPSNLRMTSLAIGRSVAFLLLASGNWIGWLPWDDVDVVDTDGEYLGTIFSGHRFYRRPNPLYRGYPGYPAKAGVSQRRLARDLDVTESEVRRMLKLGHATKAIAPCAGWASVSV